MTETLKKRGISIVEILVALGIGAIILSSSMGVFRLIVKTGEDADFKKALTSVQMQLEKARSLATSSKDAVVYGIHFEPSQITLFKGSTYSAGESSNEVTSLNNKAIISDISFSDGNPDVIFQKITGEPKQFGSIIISQATDTDRNATLVVERTGVVTVVESIAPGSTLSPLESADIRLSAHVALDENSGSIAYDSTPWEKDFNITGAIWAPGKLGLSSLYFDGSGDRAVSISAMPYDGATNRPRAISAWIKIDQFPPSNCYGVARWGSESSARLWELMICNSNVTANWWGNSVSGGSVTLGAWHHVAISFDGSVVKVYLNGAEVASKATTLYAATNTTIVIGDAIWSGHLDFKGYIDDVRIYGTRSLSLEEVQALYGEGN